MVSEAYLFPSVVVVLVDYAFPFTVVVAAIYLAIVRFMDLNEKEPIWALGLMLVLGIIAAMIVDLLVSDVLLGPYPLWQSLIEETAKFVAFYLGAVALTAVARMRGWLEINELSAHPDACQDGPGPRPRAHIEVGVHTQHHLLECGVRSFLARRPHVPFSLPVAVATPTRRAGGENGRMCCEGSR
jgi:hypothetical protein